MNKAPSPSHIQETFSLETEKRKSTDAKSITEKSINTMDLAQHDKSSVLVEIFGKKYRALIYTGADSSVINRKITEQFPDLECLPSNQLQLCGATGDKITIAGEIDLRFKLGKKHLAHTFIVAENISKSVILGRDCLSANKMKIDFGRKEIEIDQERIPLENEAYLASLVRVANKTILRPQTSTLVWGKFKGQGKRNKREVYHISAIDTGFIGQEPGLMVTNTVSNVSKHKKVPFLICNNTGKSIRLNRGNVVARAEEVTGECVSMSDLTHDFTLMDDEGDTGTVIIPEEYREELSKLLRDNEDLFANSDMDIGGVTAVSMKIDTRDEIPIRQRPYRTPINQRPVVERAIQDMIDAKIIRPSKSPWSFPILLVPKKDGGRRFCVDFRKLNQITRTYVWPLPHLDDILCSMSHCNTFSSIDLRSGFWQIPMDEDSKEKVAFSCHKGLYEFNKMPFGLTNAPSVFQELMTHVLEGIDGKFAIAYLDDIVIFSRSASEHLEHLTEIFARLRKFGLKMKPSKCKFMEREIKYLGYVVGAEGVKVDKDKVKVIEEMRPPTDVRGVRSFVGCVSYYRRFCPNFSEVATPLIQLTKKHAQFEWTDACQSAFERLKRLLTEAPTLAFPDPNCEYILYTDASDGCVGAVLTQDQGQGEQPIHYLSHKLSETQKRWPILEKEAFAMHYALQKLDHYLHDASFVIRCDHKPLKYLLSSEMKNRKVQKWAIDISSYKCRIEYIKGKDNEQADMLSRLSHDDECADESTSIEIDVINSNRVSAKHSVHDDDDVNVQVDEDKLDLPDLAEEQKGDPELNKLRSAIENPLTSRSMKRYAVVDDLLYYLSNDDDVDPRMRLMIPDVYKQNVLEQYHNDCAHWGIEKTFGLIRKNYHWIGMYKDVVDYVTRCITCKVRMLKKKPPPLQEMDKVIYPGQKWGLDLCGPYPESSSGMKYILTAVDLYSGWPELWALPDKRTDNIVRLVIDELIPRFSCPEQIVTDNGMEFRSKVFDDMCRQLNIRHVNTSPYRPQGNSKCERMHRVLTDMLSKKTGRHLDRWDQHLPSIAEAIRAGNSESTGYSPFFLMYTRDPVFPLDNILRPRRRYMGEDYHKIALERQHEAFMHVRRNLRKARAKQKRNHDKKAVAVDYQIGDPVYLFNNSRQCKLDDKWVSHYRIIEQNSPVTYTIRNQLTGDVRKVHAEHLALANLDDWPMPAPRVRIRQTRYVVPPDDSESEYFTADDTDSEDDVPLAQLKEKWTD